MSNLVKFIKWIIGIFLGISMIFLRFGDADDRYWFALFKENEYLFILLLLIVIRRLIILLAKDGANYKEVLRDWGVLSYVDAAIAFVSFYCIFHIAILLEPLRPYRDFTQNPAIIALFSWGFVCYITIKIFTNAKR